MSIKWNRYLVGIFLLASVLLDPISASEKNYKIICLGDSFTSGFQLTRHHAYPALIQKKINNNAWSVINAGVADETTAGGLSRINWIVKGNPAIVVVALGMSDSAHGIKAFSTQRNLDKIIYKIQESGAIPILVGMQSRANNNAQLAQVFKLIAQKYTIAFIPFVLEDVATHPELTMSDGRHPNVAGHRIMADQLWPSIHDALLRCERGEK